MKSPRAKMLKLANMTSNLRALVASPPTNWSREGRLEYIEWARQVAVGCRGVSIELERTFDVALNEASARHDGSVQ